MRFIQPDRISYGLPWMVGTVEMYHNFVRATFILKYCKKLSDAYPYVRHVFELTDDDLDKFLEGDPKPYFNRCQYCCVLACCTLSGGLMPPTPSPYQLSKWQQHGTTTNSSTTLTEQQYNSLYRDFNHASQIELRDRMPSKGERIEKLGARVEAEMLKIIHTFTSEVFTALVEEYLELFEEMVKSLILLKEAGITLEDICPVSENSHVYHCQWAYCTTNMYSNFAFCRPYKVEEFEKLLLDELIKQFESLRSNTKCDDKMPLESDHNAKNKESRACDCEHITKHDNPYLAFLTEIKSYSPPNSNTDQFSKILHSEKQMFLKTCLKLLRGNDYFRYYSQSSSKSEQFYDDEDKTETSSPKCRGQQDNNDGELYNMSVTIYNQTICHVQSAIFAIFRSLEYDELGRRRILPLTPDRTQFERISKVSESKNLIKKSLSGYLEPTDLLPSSEDEVFTYGSLKIDNTGQDDPNKQSLKHKKLNEEFQAMPSIKYEKEIKNGTKQKNYDHCVRGLQQEFMIQHPKPEYTEDVRCQTNKDLHRCQTLNPQKNLDVETGLSSYNLAKTDLSPSSTQQENTAEINRTPENVQKIADKTVFLQPKSQESEINLFNRSIFKSKKNHSSVICVFNYYEPEVTHIDAIAFIKKLKMEGGVLHYPHCSENTVLTKIVGPSFYFSVCCADCRQELAPPQKLEAFKAESKNTHQSKIMSHILRKSRASFYFPVRCGSCGFLLCDPQKPKKHLFVPFHSAVKGYICSSRLKSHECESVFSKKEYTGCRSDTITNSDTQKMNEGFTKQYQAHDYLNKSQNRKYIYRSRSLPLLALRKDYEFRGIMGNENMAARKTTSLKFENAVANILDIWTYEMINYEKGANSPHLRTQILNYRKSLSVFIKKDIREKLYYRHILSVFKRVEDYESPILEFKDRISAQTNMLNYKIMKKSHSCQAKLRYEACSTIQRANYKSLECNNNTSLKKNCQHNIESENDVEHLHLISNTFNRKNMVRPLSLHSELKPPTIQRRRSYSFSESVYTEDYSTQMNAWKNELQELQKNIESPDLIFELNRKNMARPLSLHSELKQQTLVNPRWRRSSCSFATEKYKDYSTSITAWKNELLKLQKSAESLTLRPETRKKTARPRSLHSEVYQKPQVTKRRRSYSLTESTSKEEFSTRMNAWKKELLELQKSAQSPRFESESLNRKKVRPLSLHSEIGQRPLSTQCRRSCSFTESELKENLSSRMSAWDKKMQELQKSVDSPNLRSGAINRNINKVGYLRPEQEHSIAGATHRPKSESLNRFSSQLNKPKSHENGETQHLRSETIYRKNMVNSLRSEPKVTAIAYRRQSESKINIESSSELNEWKNKLINLQKSVESPQSKSKTDNRKINIKARSFDSGPKPSVGGAAFCPKSELDDSLTELKTWNLKLRELERDAISPHLRPKPITRKVKARAVSLNTEPKRTTTVSTTRPKSESVLDDFSTELETWKHELLTLEEDAKNPQPDPLNRKNMAITMNSELKYKNVVHAKRNFESLDSKKYTSRGNTRMVPKTPEPNVNTKISSQNKSPVRRYSATPRQLPAIPKNRNVRRHSHYETTGNFVNLLSNRNETQLNTYVHNPTVPTNDSDAGSIHPRNEAPDRYLKPDESVSRSRFFSQ